MQKIISNKAYAIDRYLVQRSCTNRDPMVIIFLSFIPNRSTFCQLTKTNPLCLRLALCLSAMAQWTDHVLISNELDGLLGSCARICSSNYKLLTHVSIM